MCKFAPPLRIRVNFLRDGQYRIIFSYQGACHFCIPGLKSVTICNSKKIGKYQESLKSSNSYNQNVVQGLYNNSPHPKWFYKLYVPSCTGQCKEPSQTRVKYRPAWNSRNGVPLCRYTELSSNEDSEMW